MANKKVFTGGQMAQGLDSGLLFTLDGALFFVCSMMREMYIQLIKLEEWLMMMIIVRVFCFDYSCILSGIRYAMI